MDGEPHNAKTLKNFINIIASKNDLLYKALQIKPERMRWCKKMDSTLVDKIKRMPSKKYGMKDMVDFLNITTTKVDTIF